MMIKRLRGSMGNVYTNYKKDLATNTNPVVLYTVPDKVQAIIKSIRVSDDSATASTITVTITDVAAVAQQGEIITVTPGHADRLHVVLSVLEISNNT